jgi:hypothetical protein
MYRAVVSVRESEVKSISKSVSLAQGRNERGVGYERTVYSPCLSSYLSRHLSPSNSYCPIWQLVYYWSIFVSYAFWIEPCRLLGAHTGSSRRSNTSLIRTEPCCKPWFQWEPYSQWDRVVCRFRDRSGLDIAMILSLTRPYPDPILYRVGSGRLKYL